VREIRTLRSTWRGLETWHGRDAVTPRNRKGEETGNTNCDLNRRASLRPYLAANLKKRQRFSLPLLYLSAAVEMMQRRPALAVTFCARCTARCPWR